MIPAGEASVTFEISVPDNDTAQTIKDMVLNVSASGHTATYTSFTVEDDDVPGVILEIAPGEVSENAGIYAAYATLTRSDAKQISKPITIRLKASQNDSLILPSSITIPKYTMAVRFAIGVVDNIWVDGDREIEISGSILIESCGCDGQPSTGDAIHSSMVIHDDDGPALSVSASPATMKEGLGEAGVLVVSQNTTLESDLLVMLSHDGENEIEIPYEIVIPAGEKSVSIPVKTLDDGVTDGNRLVSIYADADGFSSSATWIQVSDQNLPDLTIKDVTPLRPSVVGGSPMELSFTLSNEGFTVCPSGVVYAVHFGYGNSLATSDSTYLVSGRTEKSLSPNESVQISIVARAPIAPGDGHIGVVVDPNGTMVELDEINNTAWSEKVVITPQYTVDVALDDDVFLQNTPVTIRGRALMADGMTVAVNVLVDVYILNDGYRRTIKATTDFKGEFGVVFTPLAGEAGVYRVGASYPDLGTDVTQAKFSILGLNRTSNSNVVFDLHNGESCSNTVNILNLSDLPLSGITVSIIDKPM